MKKVLLSSVAVIGLASLATPAAAQVKLDLGGYFKGYGVYTSQDDGVANVTEERSFDIIRETEIHFGGETTLDNGLTVGAHFETQADRGDGMNVQESYVYMSGGWGRVNVGAEDGAAYLLQVEAPSADSNLDGIRQYVNPFNSAEAGVLSALDVANGGLDYDQDATGYNDKLTYLSPIMNGFQVGVSYTPDLADSSLEDAANREDQDNEFGAAYDAAVRYEGQFNNVGVILGAGYTHVDLEDVVAVGANDFTDDRTQWNVGADFDIGPFGVGVAYMEDDFGDTGNNSTTVRRDEEETWVVGVDYTTGPFKLGASYINKDGAANVIGDTGNDGVESERYTGGVTYTYGPGMTFRGSVSYVDHDNVAGLAGTDDDIDATSVLLGTQINF